MIQIGSIIKLSHQTAKMLILAGGMLVSMVIGLASGNKISKNARHKTEEDNN